MTRWQSKISQTTRSKVGPTSSVVSACVMVNRHPVIRVLRNVAGFVLVVLGVVGLVTPFLQGILFIVLGLVLIDLPIKHRIHLWWGNRFRTYRWIAIKHHSIKRALVHRRRDRKARKAEQRGHPDPGPGS